MATLGLRRRERTHSDDERTEPGDRGQPDAGASDAPVTETPLFRIGRALFGGVLAFFAVDNLRNLEERIGYAESKNAPFPSLSVPGISGGLLVGSIGIALWRRPSAAATAIAAFFASVTPVMHDFWNLEDPEEKQQELLHFFKNTALLGAALAFLRLGRREE